MRLLRAGIETSVIALWLGHENIEIRTSNAIERLHEEFKRRIKTQTVLPCAETAAMLIWALAACLRKLYRAQRSGQQPNGIPL
jgi:transposase-like protein